MRFWQWLREKCPRWFAAFFLVLGLAQIGWQLFIWPVYWDTFQELRTMPPGAELHVLSVAMVCVPVLVASLVLGTLIELFRGRGIPYWMVVAWHGALPAFVYLHFHVMGWALAIAIGKAGPAH
jgi:hypothetical protein